jgi:hypothetical protein
MLCAVLSLADVLPPFPQNVIENDFTGTGDVVVSRVATAGGAIAGAYTWRVTFLDLYGVVPQITAAGAPLTRA